MGNHDAGRAIVHTAVTLANLVGVGSQLRELTPLEILDLACEPYRTDPDWASGTDVEFDGAYYPDEPFGQLIQRAFDPDGLYDAAADPDGDVWWETIYVKFRDRYGFC